jgi:hypothetical protein
MSSVRDAPVNGYWRLRAVERSAAVPPMPAAGKLLGKQASAHTTDPGGPRSR